jgi:RNA polymerase sigma factor (sigma-70 family)
MDVSNVDTRATRAGAQSAGDRPRRERVRPQIAQESPGDLLRLAAKGHQEAWTEMVRRFDPMIKSIARRTGLNGADAADVSQETWVRLARHIERIREPEQVRGWLACTARRESLRMAVAASRQVPVAEPIDRDTPSERVMSGAADEALAYQLEPEMVEALSRLTPVGRRVVGLLISNADLSYEEIAARLGIPMGSVGPTRQRALQLLRRQMSTTGTRGRQAA